jgi:hypothetical protein
MSRQLSSNGQKHLPSILTDGPLVWPDGVDESVGTNRDVQHWCPSR